MDRSAVEQDFFGVVEPVVGWTLEEGLPLGDDGEIEDRIADFRVPAAVLDQVGLFAEWKEVREVLNVVEEGCQVFKGAFEFSLNQDSHAVAISSGWYLDAAIIELLLKRVLLSKVIVMIHISK